MWVVLINFYKVCKVFICFSLIQAALIMQVLQLTDEEIADLPPEQRQSILILKEQIKSG